MRTLALAAPLVLGLAALVRPVTAAPEDAAERRVTVMGTVLDVAVRLPNREQALAAAEKAILEVSRVEDLLTTWRDSPLTRLNDAAPGQPMRVDPELLSIVSAVFDWSARTRHAFDPTVLPLLRAWDIRGRGRIASPSEIASARGATGTDHFQLDAAGGTIVRLDRRSGIDEGAWGKGYALDRAGMRLRAAGAENALLDLGGQVLALGSDAGGPWSVSIAHPRERGRPVARLSLPPGSSVSTSGDSERRLSVDGRKIGHLFDPRTGEPAADFGSVCVVSPSATVADVLSTAFFVLGPREGLDLSAALRREGVGNEALFLVDRGARLDALASPGFGALVLSFDPDVVVGLSRRHP